MIKEEECVCLMKTEKQYFDQAISLKSYMDQMKKHKDGSFQIYDQFECPKDDEFIKKLKEVHPEILVITEDWCGDAMLNNPILRKISEAANLEVRVVYRDEDTDLIDRHLTNGGRSIPMYLLLDKDGEVVSKWGPRAVQLEDYVMSLKNTLPAPDSPEFKGKQQELINQLTTEYTLKPEHWLTVYEDIRKKIMPVLQTDFGVKPE